MCDNVSDILREILVKDLSSFPVEESIVRKILEKGFESLSREERDCFDSFVLPVIIQFFPCICENCLVGINSQSIDDLHLFLLTGHCRRCYKGEIVVAEITQNAEELAHLTQVRDLFEPL